MRRSDWGPQEKDPRSARAPRQRPTSALWANFCDKVLAEVRSHSACWATVNPTRPAGVHEQTTRERWQQIHDLLGCLDFQRQAWVLGMPARHARQQPALRK